MTKKAFSMSKGKGMPMKNNGFIKKLVRAWDPDFTKVTPDEARQIEKAEQSGFVDDSEIDWEHLGIE